MIHPTRRQLESLCHGTPEHAETSTHVSACEFCRELCEQLRQAIQPPAAAAPAKVAPDFERLRQRLWFNAVGGLAVPLELLRAKETHVIRLLAADSRPSHQPDIVSVATLYSENPEVVMRLMRDQRIGQDYLQLIAGSPEYVQHVLVRVPDESREYITDADGRAVIGRSGEAPLSTWRWEIRLPDAVFELTPLVHDPGKVEYSSETTLETTKQDKIRVRFEGLTEGKQISVELLALEGASDFEPVKIVLVQGDSSESQSASSRQQVLFALKDPTRRIDLRIFS